MHTRNRKCQPVEKRFWSKVNKTETHWLWTASKTNTFGHGAFALRSRRKDNYRTSAHRASWIIHFGKIKKGLHVLHRCRIPYCVNPDHLYLGTPSDNHVDMGKDGTKPMGEHHANHKLTDSQVIEMRKMYSTGNYSILDISRQFGVGGPTAWKAITRRGWKHI